MRRIPLFRISLTAAAVLIATSSVAVAQCPIDPSQCDPCFFDPSLCSPVAPPVPSRQIIGLHPDASAPSRIVSIQTDPFFTTQVGTASVPSLSGLDVQPGTGVLFASSGQRDGGRLFTISPSTGASTLVGPTTGYTSVPGLAFDLDGTLYGAAGVSGALSSRLIQIDPNTGAGQFVGLFGSVGANMVRGVDAIAIHPTSGILYASSGFAFDQSLGDIFSINKSTGIATRLGELREYGTNALVQQGIAGLAFDSSGNLFGSLGFQDGRLIHIELGSFMFQYVGDTGSRSLSDIAVIDQTQLLLGDGNNDGTVTADDLVAVQQFFGNAGPNFDGTDLGDANDDGVVTADDLVAVQQFFGNTLAVDGPPVPEPITLALLAGGLMVMLRRRL